jgi:hypothetical protein
MKNGVFWVVTPCGSCKNRRFGGTWRPFIRVTKIGELGTTLAVTSNRRKLRSYYSKKKCGGNGDMHPRFLDLSTVGGQCRIRICE